MKKTYIIPNCKSAEIETFDLCVNSPTLTKVKGEVISSEEEILVKEQQSFNAWDNEW